MSSLNGNWVNSYGSTLHLASDGEFLFGYYCSSTGSTGQYYVCGYGGTAAPSVGNGVGLALSILWRSYVAGEPDPSWHWVSGFGGQIILQANDVPNIILNHDLVATMPFPGVGGIGSYPDKLVFGPLGNSTDPGPQKIIKQRSSTFVDPVVGTWLCRTPDIALSLTLLLVDDASGLIEGQLTINDNGYMVRGFADNAKNGPAIALEGLTLSASLGNGIFTVFSGWLDLATQRLTLMQQTSSGTASGAQYMQTSARGLYFERA